MFSRSVVEARLAQLQQQGVYLHYHTTADVDRMNSNLSAIYQQNPETEVLEKVRELTPEEIKWVQNERLLCRIDFRYWVSRYVWIKNEEDRTVRMEMWRSQEIFLDIIGDMEAQQIAIMMIILKARQLGLSRIISLILLHGVIFFSNINAFMASSTEDKTRLLFDMTDFVFERLPWWMKPAEKFRRENKLLELMNGSGVTLQHGQQTSGIARGTTPTLAHISELAEFDDPSSLIDSSLLRAMHDSPTTKLFLEGTAEGQNNWWHRKWESAKAGWPENTSRLRPLFLPWFVGGLYPKEAWLRAHPIPENYEERMLPWALDHAQMAGEYVRNSSILSQHLGEDWEMPLKQVWYYECERESAIREKRLNRFLQEMPANDDEAFQTTNISVFDTETITYYRDRAHRYPLVGAYGLRGPSEYLPERLQPSPLLVDSNREPIHIRAAWGSGYPIPFTLVPLRFDGWTLESAEGGIDKIYLWEKPEPGEVYGLGVDTADGIGKDSTVIEVLKKGSVYAPAKQVGEFASSKMNALDATPFCLALGTLFAVPDAEGFVKQPRMAIECKGNGDQTQLRLKMHGWNNFHPWTEPFIDNKKIDLSRINKIGVFTNFQFRVGMIDMLVKMVRDLEIEICSPFWVSEMASLEADDFNQSIRADYGGHDDRVMALGFIITSLYKFDLAFAQRANLAIKQAYGQRQTDGKRTHARFTPGLQEIG